MKEFIDKLIEKIVNTPTKCLDTYSISSPDIITGVKNGIEYGCASRQNEIIDIVNELAEEYKGGWIPCSERLPSESGKYLVTTKNMTGCWILENNVFVCDYAYDTFIFQGWEDNEVIAWCELPAPYTEGE